MLKKISIIIILLFLVLGTACARTENSSVQDQGEQVEDTRQADIGSFGDSINLSLAGKLSLPGQAIDVDVKDSYAYLTDDLGQLYVIDFAELNNPAIMGKVKGIDSANIIIIDQDYAYVSYTSWEQGEEDYYTQCGFKIVDISNPDSPKLIGDYISGSGTEKTVQGIFIEGNYAYLNSTQLVEDKQESQLEIVNILDKENPVKVSSIGIEGMPWGIHVSQDYAYINTTVYGQDFNLGQQSKLIIVNVKTPGEPQLVSSLQIMEGTAGIYAWEDYVFISNNTLDFEPGEAKSYLQVIGISDKKNPMAQGKCLLSGQGWELDMVDGYVLISDLDGGIHAVDISDKDNPAVVDFFHSSGTSYDITVEGNYGYVADGFSGIAVLSLSGEGSRKDSLVLDEDKPPVASIEISGDSIEEDVYPLGIPVYFSAASSYDLNGDDLDFEWQIDGNQYQEEKVSHVFDSQGGFQISLMVSDGNNSSEASESIEVKEADSCVVPVESKQYTVEIEYLLKNLGSIPVSDINCYASVPQTYLPFQKVKELSVSNQDYQIVYDQSFNKILNIDFDQILVGPSEELRATVTAKMEMTTFDFKDLDYPELSYLEDSPGLDTYTMADLYIDSDSKIIKEAAASVIREESRPVIIMEKLYYYVVDKLEYDFARAADPQYPLMYASEILQEGKGVCADYAILYAALLRASGIPCRVASGIPVYTALLEGGELDIGHAWVEIKFPQYGWVPIDITIEDYFMGRDYNMNLATERGSGFLHRNMTMDWSSYYFDGFTYSWEGDETPEVEQSLIYRILD